MLNGFCFCVCFDSMLGEYLFLSEYQIFKQTEHNYHWCISRQKVKNRNNILWIIDWIRLFCSECDSINVRQKNQCPVLKKGFFHVHTQNIAHGFLLKRNIFVALWWSFLIIKFIWFNIHCVLKSSELMIETEPKTL